MPVVVALVALLVYAPRGFTGILHRDVALYAYAGQQFADGVLPYVGVLNRAGPLAHALPRLGVLAGRLVGVDDVVGARVLFMLFAIGCVVLAYLVTSQLFHSRLGGLVAAGSLLSLPGFSELAAHGPREKTAMVLLVYLAAWATLHRRWFTTGVLVSLATLTWQPAFFVAFTVAAVAALLVERGGRIRALGRVVAGGLTPLAAVLLVYAVAGHLRTFLDAFVLIHAQHTTQSSGLDRPARVWQTISHGYGWGTWGLLVGLAGMLALAVASGVVIRRGATPAWWPSRVAAAPVVATLVALGASLLAGIAWSGVAFNNWPDAFFLLPAVTIGVGGLVAILVPRLPSLAATGVATGVVLALVVTSTVAAGIASARASEERLGAQRASVQAVLDRLGESATLLSVQAPAPLVLTQRRNPSPYQMFAGGLTGHMNDTYPGGLPAYADWVIQEAAPTVIAIQGRNRWIRPRLRQHYRPAGRAPGWQWWVRASVPESVTDDIRRATRGVLHGMKRSAS